MYAVRYWCVDGFFCPGGWTLVRGVAGPNNIGLVVGWHFLWQGSRFTTGVVVIFLDGGVVCLREACCGVAGIGCGLVPGEPAEASPGGRSQRGNLVRCRRGVILARRTLESCAVPVLVYVK